MVNTNSTLSETYQFDPELKIWQKPDALPFKYSDGDRVENAIGDILSKIKDKSVNSDELKTVQNNWPNTYYFSANRANLLRPLEKNIINGGRILELGCGMGAITRYLGENASEVIAVEGSQRRGRIAALRCEDLDNVHIIIDNFLDLPASLGSFDAVTLIGVLEYARRFGGEQAEKKVLEKAKSFLKPSGALILAIENKLGLKYFGGVPEDHLNKAWISICNGYSEKGVRTWSRKELEKLLRDTGFKDLHQFIASPDYKLPVSIVSPEGLALDEELDLSAILGNAKRNYEPFTLFNFGEATNSICNAGLLSDLANSLCYVAFPEKKGNNGFEAGKLIYHYGNNANFPAKFAKTVTIEKAGNKIEVKRKKDFNISQDAKAAYYQKLEDEPYLRGELLLDQIRKVVMRPDWTIEEFLKAFEPWTRYLWEHADAEFQCDGSLLDFTPFNIVMQDDKPVAFDQEWVSRKKLPLQYLLYRGFMATIIRLFPLRKSSSHNIETFSAMFREFMKSQNLPESLPVSLDYLWWQEIKFMKFVNPLAKSMPPKDFKILYML